MGNATWSILAHQPESSVPSPDEIYCTLACRHIESGETSVAIRFLNQAQDVNKLSEGHRLSPLHISIANGNATCVQHLVDRGADTNVTDGRRFTPLHVAADAKESAIESAIQCCQTVIATGADVDYQDIWGKTPVQRAIAYDNTKLAALLIDSGCDVNKTDNSGRSAMTYIANNLSMVQWQTSLLDAMLQKGGDLNLKDNKGKSPLYYALLIRNMAVLEKIPMLPRNKVDFSELMELAVSRCYVDVLKYLLMCGASVPEDMVHDKLGAVSSYYLSQLGQVFTSTKLLLSADGRSATRQMVLEVIAAVISFLTRRAVVDVQDTLVSLLCTMIAVNCIPLSAVWPVLNINTAVAERVKNALGYDNVPNLAAVCRMSIRKLLLKHEANVLVGVVKLDMLPQALTSFLLFEEY